MKLISLETGLMGANCYVLYCEETKECAVIDPGGDVEIILEELEQRKLLVKYIILTHGHFDHIGAVKALKESTKAQIAIHTEDAPLLLDIHRNASFMLGQVCIQEKPDILLKDGDQLTVGELHLEIIYTPGHTDGGICILADQLLFTGDTLFFGSIGRTDLLGGDQTKLMQSIHDRLLSLKENYTIYPGHGEKTTLDRERKRNPYL